MDKNIFSQNFNSLISQRDVKIKDLSSKTGIRSEKLSKFRNSDDPVNPSVDDLISISDFFNVSIDELLGHSKQENPQSIMLDFFHNILKLEPYVDIRIDSNMYEASSKEKSRTGRSLNQAYYFNTFPFRDTPYEAMYNDIISTTFTEYLKIKKEFPNLEDVWLADRIKKLDTLYHFDEQSVENESTENETKDSE